MAAPIIGGNGYRWRGRAIRTIRKQNITCVTMPRKDSAIMVPVSVSGESQYKVIVTASKNSGNGAILVNFFGGKNYDGEPISINVSGAEMRDYTVAVPVPKFPNNLPMYIRVWRPNDSTGNIFIKTIQYSHIGGVVTIPREPKLTKINVVTPQQRVERSNRPIKHDKIVHKKNQNKANIKKTIREDNSMQFKPYEVKKSTSMADKVLVTKPSDVPKVSIITPTRDGLNLIKKCYEALSKNTSYPNWEWVVGDSLSTDGTEEYFKSLNDDRVTFIQRGTIDGSFSSINNELAKVATGEYLLFLNNDTEPQPFWLYELVSKIHKNDNIGVVGAQLLYSEDRIQHAGIAFIPQGPANLGKSVLGSFPKGYAKHDRFLQAVTGACFIMRARDFNTVGGFDPIYYFCYEDVDLCLKIKFNLNKKILYAANSKVIHSESVTQKKHKTSGEKQQVGIKAFKDRWMSKVEIDFPLLQRDANKGLYKVDVSFVTCVNNMSQYRNYVVASLFKNQSNKNYEIIPIINFGNPYSAAEALNVGLDMTRSDLVVFCHQDVVFYENWVEMMFERVREIEKAGHRWGVIGTAGITKRDDTVGVVHNMKGKLQWQSNRRATTYEVQTVDEHCIIIKKSSGLRFDHVTFNGFHFYGPDICLNALSRGFKNFGILCPLIHDSSSGSLVSGKKEFMRLLNALAKKWRSKFDMIRTPTSIIRKRSVRTFVKFNNS